MQDIVQLAVSTGYGHEQPAIRVVEKVRRANPLPALSVLPAVDPPHTLLQLLEKLETQGLPRPAEEGEIVQKLREGEIGKTLVESDEMLTDPFLLGAGL
jgi:hypothetical protein